MDLQMLGKYWKQNIVHDLIQMFQRQYEDDLTFGDSTKVKLFLPHFEARNDRALLFGTLRNIYRILAILQFFLINLRKSEGLCQ